MKIGFIGTGQMAQALAGGISSGMPAAEFLISDPNEDARAAFRLRVAGAKVEETNSNADVLIECDVTFLAFKPQVVELALDGIADSGIAFEGIVVSILAGVTMERIAKLVGTEKIVRVMPNTPCLIGCGASGMAGSDSASEADLQLVEQLLSGVSLVRAVDEASLDAVTGLSGSGPAYVFTFIEAMVEGGMNEGLSEEVASDLAVQTVLGAARLVQESDESTSVLRERVTSPGGTTLAGLRSLDKTGFRQSVVQAVAAATARSVELGRGG